MRGKLLGGRYQVLQVLAQGGFGQTYIAKDMHRPGNPQCVVKHLQPTTANSRFLHNARRLFQTEAEILEKLGHHDQIPRLLAYFEENQEFYLVQEFIQGQTLTAQLQPGKRWSESQVYQLLQEILVILVFVHSHGAIHRDIKPDNIIRRSDGKLVLVDFGSVKQAWTQVITAHEQTHSIFANHLSPTIAIGTPGYMPTEQGRGKPQPNSDIYALGMIAIQALTGINPTQLLEESDTGEIVWQHQANVSSAIAKVITKMVRYNFRNRYQTAKEALAAVELELAAMRIEQQPHYATTTSSIQPDIQQSVSQNPLLLATANSCRSARKIAHQGSGKLKRTATNVSITQPTVFVASEHQTAFLNHNSLAQSAVSSAQTNSQPSHTVIRVTHNPLPLRIVAVITAMLTSVVAIYALKSTLMANTNKIEPIPTQTRRENQKCVQAAQTRVDECRLTQANELAAAKDFQAAIALAGQIPPTQADYPAARELIAQWSNRLLEIATNHYRAGELKSAIDKAKVIPQTSPNYDKTQATIKQWDKQWKKNYSHWLAAKSALEVGKWHNAIVAAKSCDHPYWQKQVEPIIQKAQAKISTSKTVITSKPKRTITKRLNPTWAKPVSQRVTSTNKSTKPRTTSSVARQASHHVPRRTAAVRQLSRTIPRRLPSSLTKSPASIGQRSKRITHKTVRRSSVKRSTRIIYKRVKRVSKSDRTIVRSYRWVTKTVR